MTMIGAQNHLVNAAASAAKSIRQAHVGARTARLLVIWGLAWSVCLGAVQPSVFAQGKKKLPPEESRTLLTKDNLRLHCLYFPGTQGKDTVPLILVHGWGEESSTYRDLAQALQARGYAVFVPDLRGHGRSTFPSTRDSTTPEQVRERLTALDIRAMYQFDLEAVKQYALEKNNAGDLNIELLGVIGVDVGAIVAAHWAARDWSWQDLYFYKQGKDVKAVVLISPPQNFRRVQLPGAVTALMRSNRTVTHQLSIMLIAGDRDEGAKSSVSRMSRMLQRYYRSEEQGLEVLTADTDVHGLRLLGERVIGSGMLAFLQRRLVDRRDQFEAWERRVKPGES